jgi:hypothetical protein
VRSSVTTFIYTKGFYPIFFVDEIQQLYEDHQKLESTQAILREFMIILESVHARVFFLGSSQSLITKVIDKDGITFNLNNTRVIFLAYKEYYKLNSSRISTTRMLPY